MNRIFAIAAAITLASAGTAFAHHPLGGMTPQNFMQGFLSGIGHPVIGFDHLAFVVAVGLIAAFHANRLVMPALFVVGTVAGTALTLAAVTLPLAELVITGSVIAGGIDIQYPPENADLHDAIAESGLLLVEMPPGTQPTPRHFPFATVSSPALRSVFL